MSNTEPVTGAVPLSAPYYGASLGIAFSRFWRKYATFSGRASRSEGHVPRSGGVSRHRAGQLF